MVNWKRDRERNLQGDWGDIRVEHLLNKADVHIAPDYSKILHYTVDPMHKQYGIGVREKSVVPAILWGIVAALVVVAVSAVL